MKGNSELDMKETDGYIKEGRINGETDFEVKGFWGVGRPMQACHKARREAFMMESGGQELSRQRSLWRDQGDHQQVLQGLAEPGKRPGDVLAQAHRLPVR